MEINSKNIVQKVVENSKKGFTLIELLVAVLIVGILVAICVPKYLLAVDRSMFASLESTTMTLKGAYERYYFIHDAYPKSFDSLDIDLEGKIVKPRSDYECKVMTNMFCCISKGSSSANGTIRCGKIDETFFFTYTVMARPNSSIDVGQSCGYKTNNKRAQRLCDSYQWSKKQNSNIFLPSGLINGYTYYSLQ